MRFSIVFLAALLGCAASRSANRSTGKIEGRHFLFERPSCRAAIPFGALPAVHVADSELTPCSPTSTAPPG
jgi:hypothetical protein